MGKLRQLQQIVLAINYLKMAMTEQTKINRENDVVTTVGPTEIFPKNWLAMEEDYV